MASRALELAVGLIYTTVAPNAAYYMPGYLQPRCLATPASDDLGNGTDTDSGAILCVGLSEQCGVLCVAVGKEKVTGRAKEKERAMPKEPSCPDVTTRN